MKNALIVLFLALHAWLVPQVAPAQRADDLYQALEFRKAYANGTRSRDGKPGPNYWQNRSDYKISVELVPGTRQIKGEETVTYFNNSPDTLQMLVVRLYPNIFKKGNERDEEIDPEDVTEGVNVSLLKVNDQTLDAKPKERTRGQQVIHFSTNMVVRLAQPLMPKSSLKLTINWDYTIPKKTHIREGTYGENTFMVAYWYPQIAVYDDIDGWDTFAYGGQTEFYNDFSNFDVTVKVPPNFLVWGTGVWQNPDQILSKTYLARYQNSKKSDEITRLVTAEDLKKGGITQDKKQLAYQFKAENVPDFVFAASNRYLWDATSAVAEKNRRTAISVAYDPASKDFYEVARFSKQSVEYFSTQLPGVPFPYPNLTVFNGSGGMEFPMFVNDGSFPTEEAAEVAAHEIAHTYFPFYMGTNERKYAWMDEGWAQFLPNEIPFQIDGKTFYPQQYNAAYFSSANGREMEMPLMIPSVLLDVSMSYQLSAYMRSSVSYAMLQDVLGKEKFKQALQEYMRRWNGKHPVPYDFFFSFNDAAKEDLSWFWKPWYFEPGYADLGIKSVENGQITVARNGNLPVPVYLTVNFTDGTTETVHETARVWQTGAKTFTVAKKFAKPIASVSLGNPQVPDVDGSNNLYVAR